MELLQLKYFCHSAKTENFSHTAEKFRVPTSSVSISIKKLEEEIGVKLFTRSVNKIRLNEYGRILLNALDKCEDILRKAKSDIFDMSQSPFGELRLLILTNRQNVTEAISLFKKKYPNVSFFIKHQNDFEQGTINDYDIVISDRDIKSERFNKKEWLNEDIYLAVHKDNPLSQKVSAATSDIECEKFICMPRSSCMREYMEDYFKQKNITPEIVIECDDPLYIQKYLKMGFGVTFFPSVSWKSHINEDIKLLRIESGLKRTSCIYTNKAASNMAEVFTQILESTLSY